MKNIISKIVTTLLVSLLFLFSANAQNISGVVNSYTTVSAVSGTSVTVGSSAGLAINDPVMIIQMTGVSGGGNAGGVDNGAGNYHLAKITNIAGNTLTIDTTVTKTFTPGTERVQLVRIAKFTNDVTVVGTVSAQPWNGTTGGVIFIDACDNNITMNANIDATGDGFFGRNTTGALAVDNCGESAALVNTADENWGTDPLYFGGDFGNPAPLSGGTGRGGHGGCTAAEGAPDGGAGVGGNGANSTDATLGSGGGGGGYGGGGTSGGAGTTITGSAAPAVAGVFNAASNLRLFMGASGGSEVEWAPATGNGGGIVIVLANNITTNGSNRDIASDGNDGPNSGTYTFFGDASNVTGGAGGAGYIVVQAASINSQVRAFARGGDATTQTGVAPVFIEYGGPGGGGFVISSTAITTTAVTSGNIPVGNGALAGASGSVVTDAGVSTAFTIECLSCLISDAGKTNETCNNNLTRARSDDFVSFDLNPTGTDIGSTYTVSVNNGGVITPTTGTYGAATSFVLQDGSANNTLYTITITDSTTGTCTTTTTVQQTNCDIDYCDLSIAGNVDSDLDGVADFCDEDDDNDGILDTQELCNTDPLTLNSDVVIRVEIDVDLFSTEVGWSLSRGATTLINVPQGTYTTSDVTVSQEITVEQNANYTFIITDNFGDGIQGNSYRIIVDGVTVVNQTFGSPTDTTTFSQSNNFLITTIVTNPFSCLSGDPSGDDDGDGIINYADADFCVLNGNGVCSSLDTDNDGLINSLDTDSDDDLCFDTLEAGHTDGDDDGVLGSSPIVVNSSNGRITGQGGYTGMDAAVTNSGNTAACDNCDLLSASVSAVFCDDNGTPLDDTDDTFTFYISPNGTLLASTYSVTGGITSANISYDAPEQFGPFAISGGAITFTITDDADGSCQLVDVTVTPPSTCSASTAVDTDNDNVVDNIDIDNDNDGIIDDNENVCATRPITSGSWAGTNPFTNSAGPVGVTFASTIPAGGLVSYTPNGTMTSDSFYSDAAVEGSNSLEFLFTWDVTEEALNAAADDAVTGTITITYDQPVYNPVIHIDRLGGNSQVPSGNYISNTSLWTLQTAGLSMGKISGNNQLIVNSKQFYRDPNQNLGPGVPIVVSGEADAGGLGTAAGSIQIYGRVTTLTFSVTGEGLDGNGSDRLEMSFDSCPVVDTDGDGTPDFLDTDSDNDGCSDALEGGDNLLGSAVDGSNMLNGTVDPTTGVPNNVNTTSGQGAGSSTDSNAFDSFGQCDSDEDGVIDANDACDDYDDAADNDGDLIPDGCDVDDDNDGILDINEGLACASSAVNVGTAPAGNQNGVGQIDDIYDLNGVNVDVTTAISNDVSNDGSGAVALTQLLVEDTTTLRIQGQRADDGLGEFISYTFTFSEPVLDPQFTLSGIDGGDRVTFSATGTNVSVELGDLTSPSASSGDYDGGSTPTQNAPGALFNIISSSIASETITSFTSGNADTTLNASEVKITGTVTSFTITTTKAREDGDSANLNSITFLFSNFTYCTMQNTDADGVPDHLDTDSDEDGCADALEGAGTFMATNLVNPGTDDSLGDNVDGNGIPQVGGSSAQQGTTTAVTNSSDTTACNVPAMSVGDVTVDEDAGTASVPVSIDNPSSVDTVVSITTTDNSATNPDDYTTTTVTATIPAGQTSVNVTIPITDDVVGEPTEDFSVTGTVTSGNTLNPSDSGTVTINDNDDITMSVGDVTVDEDAGTASVPVSIDNPSSVDTVVSITTTDNSATNPDDYTTTTVTATIPAGQTSVNVTIPITDDVVGEPTEDFSVTGTVTSGNTLNPSDSGTVTINDNDDITMSVGDVTVDEDAGTASVPVSIDNPSSVDTVVSITTTDNSATNPDDYTSTTVTATIPAGQTSVNVTIPITDDVVGEPTEDFSVTGTVTSGNTLNPSDSGTVTINDNDDITMSVGDVTVDEDAGTASVPVSIDNPSSVDTVVSITTTDNSATNPDDYTSTTVTATIPAGQTSVNVTIPITDDVVGEPTEDFSVTGTVTSGNTLNPSDSGTVTINDNDDITMSVGDVTVDEDAGTASVPVSIDNPSSVDTVVSITTTDNSATNPDDYTTTTVTATIPAGQTSVNVTIPITDDVVGEPTEDFSVTGTVTSGNTLNPSDSGTVTINDNDDITMSVGDVTVDEDAGTASVPVSIDNPSSVDTVVSITTTDNSATNPDDYTTTTVTATIPAGQTSVNVTIPITDDVVGEPTEDFSVTGTVTSGNTLNPSDSGTVTINDNDDITMSVGDVTVDEDAGTASVPVSIDNPSSVDTVVSITTTDNSATNPDDYTTTTVTATIPAGQTSVNVTIPITDDVVGEPTEDFSVTGTVTSGNTLNPSDSGTVTINDNDDITMSVGDVTVDEDAGTASVPVSIDNPSSVDTVVSITTTDNSATNPDDYSTTTVTATIPAGQTSVNVTIPITDDVVGEPTEDFSVTGTVTSGNTLNPSDSGTVTINDNDTPSIVIDDVMVDEDAGTVSVPVSISNPSDEDTVVSITTTTGTAGTDDYTTTTVTATIPAGQTSVNVDIPITDDILDEGNETFDVTGTVTSGNTSNTDPSGTVTIVDNDSPFPAITIGDVIVDETVGTASVPVSIDAPSSVDTVVSITTTNDSATTPGDYTTTTTTVTIPAGQTTVNVSVPVIDDMIGEDTEVLNVNGVVTSGNTSNTNPSGTVTITDNDTPSIVIDDVMVDEDAGTVSVPVSISNPSDEDTVVSITTTTGTAGTDDYTTTTVTATIPAGQTSVNVDIPITDDILDEGNETFDVTGTVTSGNTSNTDPSGTVTIVDNDSPFPAITIGDVIVDETVGTVSVPVSIDAPSGVDTVVSITTTDDSATTPGDYTTTTTTVTIPAGQTTVNVSVPVIDDMIGEDTEVLNVNGTVTSGNTSNTNPSGTVTITDNDTPSIVIDDVMVDEDAGTVSVPVSISNPSSVDTVVSITTTTGTAGTDDYTTTTVTATIPAGQTGVNVDIPITDDILDEGNETFDVTGTVTSGNTSNTDPSGTVTIVDNDSPFPAITIGDVIVDETVGTASVPVSIDAPSGVDTVVSITTTDDSATTPGDYTTTTTTVTIPAGQTTVNVSVPVIDDMIGEDTEVLNVNGTVTSGNTSNTNPSGTVTITDNDTPSIVIDDVMVDEDAGTVSVPVSISNPSSVDTVVSITTTTGTAGTDDYTTTTVTATIPAGQTGVNVDIPITDDILDEGNETFDVTGTVTSGNTSNTDPSGTVTIVDNDSPFPAITIGDVIVDETVGTASVPVSIDAPSGVDTVVSITTTDDSATTPGDYTTTTTTVTIPAGQTTVNVSVPVIDDMIGEDTEVLNVNGTVTSGNTSNTNPSGTVTITDNDTPSIVIDDVMVDEDAGTVSVPVSISNPSDEDTVVSITTTTGTAGTDDYTTTTVTATIPAGQTSVNVDIPITDDILDEGNETFDVTGTVTSGNTSNTDPSGTVTIVDNDSPFPAITIGDVIVDETVGTVSVPVSIDAPSGVDTVVSITTTDDSATTPGDYTTTTTTVTIPAGQTTVNVSVPVIDDMIGEDTEVLNVNGTVTSGNTSNTNPSGTVTITDNDTPSIVIDDVMVDEDAGTVSVPVSISNPSDEDTVVSITTTTGTAGTDDYTTTTVTATIPAGQTSVDVIIPITDDILDEGNETFDVTGTVTSGNTSNPSDSGTVTINDDDSLLPTVSIGDVIVDETVGTASVPVSIDAPSGVDTVVSITTTDGTAGTDDYTTTTVTATIPAGQTSVNVNIPITDDLIGEDTEMLDVNGVVTSGNTANTNPSGTVTINDNDTPSIVIDDVMVDEDAGTVSVPVSISNPSDEDTVVSITTTTGTAGTDDYTTTTVTATIPAGQTSVDVIIPITDDLLDEGNETFDVTGTVTSGNTSNTDPSGTVTIVDNDSPFPAITIGDVIVDETVGTASVPVSIDAPSGVDTVVSITTTDGTAGTDDYTTTTVTATIPAGQTSVNVNIPITDDLIGEDTEMLDVNGVVTSGNTSNTNPSGTVTITDNDTPSIVIDDVMVDEDAGTVSVPVSISNPSDEDTVVSITTTTGTAGTDDYTTTTVTATIPAGQTSVNVDIPITDDILDEGNETFDVTGTVTSGNTSNTDPSGTVTIVDNDSPFPAITIGDVIVDETVGTASVPVSIDAPSGVDTVVSITTTDDSATTPGDYTTTTTTVTIPAGQTTVNVSVPVIDDMIGEDTEVLNVNGTVTSGNTSNTNPSGTVTITDNDTPSIVIDDVMVDEDAGTVSVPVSISNPSSVDTVVSITTTTGTAGTDDYTTTTVTATIPAGQTGVNVDIPITDDILDEGNETFDVTGTVTSGNTSNTDPSGTVTIVDNDSPFPAITIGDVIVDETVGTASVPVSIDAPSGVDTVVSITTTDDSATTPGDYTTTTTTVTIPAGQTTVNVSVPVIDDMIGEDTEVLNVNGTVTSGNTSNTNPSGTVTITDNDTPSIVIDDVMVDEDAGTVSVPVSISNPSSVDTVVSITTTTGTAGTDDYTTTTVTATIPAGQTGVNVDIPITDDILDEGNETFDVTGTVTSGNTSNTDPSGTVTIVDNDSPFPAITIGDVIVDETVGTASVPVSIDAPSGVDTVVSITTTDGTAGTDDYTTTTVTATIPAGQTSVNVNIPITDDLIGEDTEMLDVNGVVTSGNTANTNPSGTVTINDNDTPSIVIDDVMVDEDAGTVSVPVSISNPSSVDTVVSITTTTGTAGTDDYTTTTVTATIPAGQTGVDVIIPITDDLLDEGDETFDVTGTVTSGNTSNPSDSGTVTINDDDSLLPTVSIGDVIVDETVGTASVPVSIDAPSSVDTVVSITTTDGTAGTDDYTTTTVTATIPAGQTSVNVNIPITDDLIGEDTEVLNVNGVVTSGNTSNTNPSGTVTINDNDTPSIVIDDVMVDEDAGTVSVPVSISNPSDEDTVVSITTTTGTAGTDDYTTTTVTATIPAGQTSVDVIIPITDDILDEGNETFDVTGTVTSGNTSNPSDSGTVTINDDDSLLPTVSIGDVIVDETVGTASVPVSIDAPSGVDTVVSITTTDGTAGTDDYTTTTVTATIPAGQTSVNVNIPITDDLIGEDTEMLDVNGVVTSGNTSNTNPSGTVTITDNDTPSIVIDDVMVDEDAGTVSVPVSISNPSDEDTVVSITTTTGTAGTDDYTTTTVTATIPAGQTSVDVIIPITDDLLDEGDETFDVTGTVTSGNTSNPSDSGTVTINDDDSLLPTVSIGDVIVDETVGTASVPVSIDAPSGVDTVVSITTTDGTAGTDDYTTTTVTATIPAGQTSVNVNIPITDDLIGEDTEMLDVNGVVTSGNTSNTNPSGTVTITDNDTPSIVIDDVMVDEDAGTVSVPVSISNPSDEDTVVSITTTTGTAGTDDYTTTTVTATIPAGQTSVDVIIPITDDLLDEGDETFDVTGTVTSGNTSNPSDSGTVTIVDNDVCTSDPSTDCDGDGVTNGDELNPPNGGTPTDPTDPCSFNNGDDTVAQTAAWLAADCDGDGVTNGDELNPPNGGTPTDPTDPCSFNNGDDTVAQTAAWLAADCDGDGVTNGDELTPPNGGTPTDPTDPCSFNNGDDTVAQTAAWLAADCDGDGVTNGDELNPPNGGTPTDPTDPCSFNNGDDTVAQTAAWLAADCDGDGVTNGDELTPPNGGTPTDPTDPCSFNNGDDTVAQTAAWLAADCDGDGVTNGDELTPPNGGTPTDPTDPCSFNNGDDTVAQTAAWLAADCDGDGVTNGDELNPPNGGTPTDPTDPCSFNNGDDTVAQTAAWLAADCDGDGVTNGDELNPPNGGTPTDPTDPCSFNNGDDTVAQTAAWLAADCDGDGVTNGDELNPPNGGTPTDPTDPCSFNNGDDTVAQTAAWLAADCDGDGITNGDELNPPNGGTPTDPNDPCDFNIDDISIAQTGDYLAADCDGDGVTNGDELNPPNGGTPTDPNDPCDSNAGDITTTPSGDYLAADCDGDGITNGDELNPPNGGTPTDPTDPCDFNVGDISIAQTGDYLAADCDGDGVTNGDELNPPNGGTPTDPNNPCDLNIDDISIAQTGDYLAADCDGDGVTNGDELNPPNGDDPTNPNDPCDSNAGDITTTPSGDYLAADCDGDGVTNGDELNPPNGDDPTDPNNPCDSNVIDVTIAQSNDYLAADCDGDGVSNGDELNPPNGDDPTDPNDPCNLNVIDITLNPSQEWIDGDCDGDGIPNGPDGTDDEDGDGIPNFLDINNSNTVEDDLEIFNAVTPNGDGENDVFTIRNIEMFPDNQVRIYNRWGVLVYETQGYGQNGNYFRGISNGRVTIQQNKLLPVGTYYYVVNYVANGVSKSKAGYLYIQR